MALDLTLETRRELELNRELARRSPPPRRPWQISLLRAITARIVRSCLHVALTPKQCVVTNQWPPR